MLGVLGAFHALYISTHQSDAWRQVRDDRKKGRGNAEDVLLVPLKKNTASSKQWHTGYDLPTKSTTIRQSPLTISAPLVAWQTKMAGSFPVFSR